MVGQFKMSNACSILVLNILLGSSSGRTLKKTNIGSIPMLTIFLCK